MANPYSVLILNQISQTGLKRLPAERYAVGKDLGEPDAILVRSADMHGMDIPATVKAIGRAGAGTNNIPVKAMSARGRSRVQCARRQRQCSQGTGDRRHADGRAQPGRCPEFRATASIRLMRP